MSARQPPDRESVLTAEDADAQAAQRRVEMLERVEAAARAAHELALLRVPERSSRAAIEVVVSGRGTLVELTLGESATRMVPHELAAEILSTVRRACERAGTRVAELLEPALPAGADVDGVITDPALEIPAASPQRRTASSTEDLGEPDSWLRPAQGRAGR